MKYNDVCQTEDYKMHTCTHAYKNVICPIDVVKAEMGPDFRLESGWCIS